MEERKKEDRRREDRQKGEKKPSKPNEGRSGRKDEWETTGTALKGVPQAEIDQHKKTPDGCWRCGRTGHRTYDCCTFQTVKGTSLPPALWKVTAVTEPEGINTGKRGREEEPESLPTAKLQKVAAAELMEPTDLWADNDDSDF